MAARGIRVLFAFAFVIVAVVAVVVPQDQQKERQLVDLSQELLTKLAELVGKFSNQCKCVRRSHKLPILTKRQFLSREKTFIDNVVVSKDCPEGYKLCPMIGMGVCIPDRDICSSGEQGMYCVAIS